MGGLLPKLGGGLRATHNYHMHTCGEKEICTRLLAPVFAEKKFLRVAVCPPPIHFSFPPSLAPFPQTRKKHNYMLLFSNQ